MFLTVPCCKSFFFSVVFFFFVSVPPPPRLSVFQRQIFLAFFVPFSPRLSYLSRRHSSLFFSLFFLPLHGLYDAFPPFRNLLRWFFRLEIFPCTQFTFLLIFLVLFLFLDTSDSTPPPPPHSQPAPEDGVSGSVGFRFFPHDLLFSPFFERVHVHSSAMVRMNGFIIHVFFNLPCPTTLI